MYFEVKEKDLLGRIGIIKTSHGIIETPAIVPVINPVHNNIGISEIIKIGFPAIMTNAFLVWKYFSRQAKERGIHSLLGIKKPIVTDSGAYQLMEYGSVPIDPDYILRYQEEIGSDIGVILDIPTRYNTPHEKAKEEVFETIKRAERAKMLRKREDFYLVGPIQGGRHLDLVKHSAKKMSKLDFDIYGIGGPVQMMINYKYSELVDLILTAKVNLPINKPIHLFGAGNPMMFSLAVALGVDTFDSASYILYAKKLRYMTPNKTYRFEELKYLPCNCPVCSNFDIDYIKKLPYEEKVKLIAKHNLYVIFSEIKRIKEAIHEGSLWELVEIRAQSHPFLKRSLKRIKKFINFIEQHDPITYSIPHGIFFYDESSLLRPEVHRHLNKVKKLYPKEFCKVLILVPEIGAKPYHKYGEAGKLFNYLQKLGLNKKVCIAVYSRSFGVIPLEIDDVYPLSQYESCIEKYNGWFLNFFNEFFKDLDVKGVILLYNDSFKDIFHEIKKVCKKYNKCFSIKIKESIDILSFSRIKRLIIRINSSEV